MPPDSDGRPAGNGPAPTASLNQPNLIAHTDNGHPVGERLRQLLDDTAADEGCSLGDLTVLSVQNDPFRVDTAAGHRDGAWLANTARELGLGDRQIHNRGLHYMMIGRPKPNGEPYTNTEPDWVWLSGTAVKAARWLGYIGFDQIVDQRNAAPEVRLYEPSEPWPYLNVGLDIEIPDASELLPQVGVADFVGMQRYRIVLVGEKSSLADVLAPVATLYEADLYLPTGEISDTLVHTMAKTAADDGRPMIVLYFSDADPAGWQMPISVARKLQAFQTRLYPEIEYEVRRVALTPDQVREYGLPSTPLKVTELRGDKWREAMGISQTEIDALASLRPDLLREIAREAISPFFDNTLDSRVTAAQREWIRTAQQIVNEGLDGDQLDRIRADAAEKLSQMQAEIDEINSALRFDADDFDLPEPVVPTAELNGGGNGLPLLDSRWPFFAQCRTLIDSKAYRGAR